MFGYIKKEEVIVLVQREVELNRQMHERYAKLTKTHEAHANEGECYARDAARCSDLADEYFTRYLESKEILDQLNKL